MTPISFVRAFKDNYIWILHDKNNIWAIDPGDAQPVIDLIQQNHFVLSGILLTHHHQDHSGGIPRLHEEYGNIPVYGSHKSPIKQISKHLKHGDVISCGSFTFEVIEIPGHTLDHIAFYGNSSLFCGDTLFSVGCGKVFEGTAEQMYSSLLKLKHLPDSTKVYCGHEYTLANIRFAQHIDPDNLHLNDKLILATKLYEHNGCTLPSELQSEKLSNPFLRCDDPKIIEATEKYTKKKLSNPVEVFHQLREWKNKF